MSWGGPVDWDVATITKEIIDSSWDADADLDAGDQPRTELLTEDNDGKARQRVRRNANEYILVHEPGEREMEYSDLFMSAEDKSALVSIEASTADSRDRRDVLFRELKRIANEHRKRPDTPGNWDTLQIQTANTFDDTNFGWWVVEMSMIYSRDSDLL